MKRALGSGWLISCTLLLVVGCEKAVTIEHPGKGILDEPVPTFRVRFHNDFQPGSFQAFLNGVTITSRFQPAPAPGGVSTASSDHMDAGYKNTQVLHVQGQFKTPQSGIPTKLTEDEVEFSPPVIFVFRGNSTNHDLSLKERETIAATVLVVKAPKEALTVTVTTEENPAVSLNDQPAGTPITLTIPTNDRRADFTVRGIQTGKTFIVRALAHGFSSKAAGGTVLYP